MCFLEFSCQLLKHGDMKLGWKLYDHGLNTPAEGAQKWQRALFKPFSFQKLNLGEENTLKQNNIVVR